LKGLPEATIAKVLRRSHHADAGRRDAGGDDEGAWRLRRAGVGRVRVLQSVIAERLGFDENRANTLISEDGVLTGDVARPILGRDAKVEALEEITTRLGLTAADVLAIGDGANDLGMIERAGPASRIHAKPSVQAAAQHRINHGDLTSILFLQGYAKDEFVSP
jgi:phosphoserine phosphatase